MVFPTTEEIKFQLFETSHSGSLTTTVACSQQLKVIADELTEIYEALSCEYFDISTFERAVSQTSSHLGYMQCMPKDVLEDHANGIRLQDIRTLLGSVAYLINIRLQTCQSTSRLINDDYALTHTSEIKKQEPLVDHVSCLRKWFRENVSHPYPSKDEKFALSKASNLSVAQVNTWFANTRRKDEGRRRFLANKTDINEELLVLLEGSEM